LHFSIIESKMVPTQMILLCSNVRFIFFSAEEILRLQEISFK
jgi:hypothetical protein